MLCLACSLAMDKLRLYLILLMFTTITLYSHLGQSISESAAANLTVSILLLKTYDNSCYTEEVYSAVQEAVEKLNPQWDILQQAEINITTQYCGTASDQCGFKDAQDAFFSALLEGPNQLAIIGPPCFEISNGIAQLSRHYHIPLVTLAPLYHDQTEYLFTLLPSLTTLMDGIAQFVEAFPEWQRVAIISQDEEMFRKVAVHLEQTFSLIANVSDNAISRALSLSDIEIDKLVDNSVRIVVLNMEPTLIRAILCKASEVIQYQYIWLTPGVHFDKWWLREDNETCTDGALHEFLSTQGVLSFKPVFVNNSANDPLDLSLQAYDSVMSIALGLNSTLSTNWTQVVNDTYESPGYIRTAGSVLAKDVSQVDFQGYSGHIRFENGSRVVDTIQVVRFRSNEFVEIGLIWLDNGVNFTDGRESLWPNGIPSDGSPITEIKYPLLVITIITYIFASCNIIASVAGIIFMAAFRDRRVIRLSSPNLNYIIGIGVIVLSASVFLFVYPPLSFSTINTICAIRPWFTSIGYSLCLGTINTKMWRVYYIIQKARVTAKKKAIKDWHLFLFVSLFVIIDVIILTFATVFLTSRQQATYGPDVENSEGSFNENGIKVEYEVISCESQRRLEWLGPLLGYKIVYHIIAVFLAFKIRKVKVKVLNDSREVVLILYLTGLVLAAVILITFAFRSYQNVYTGAYSIGICVASSVIVGVVFVSKAIHLWKDPQGTEIFPTTAANKNTGITAALPPSSEMTEVVATLQRKVKNLEAQLNTIDEPKIDSSPQEKGEFLCASDATRDTD